ncbi:MAG: hypothetical protein AAF740_02790 [Bacteroidota bacterium]
MKKLIALLAMLVAMPLAAQIDGPNPQAREQIEAARVAFLTRELNLDTEQAKTFWPLFNEYESKKDEIRKELRGIRKRVDTSPDAELEKDLARVFALRRQEIVLDEKYQDKFKGMLNVRQLAKLHYAEHKFHRMMLEHLRERGGGRGKRGG